MTPGSLPINEEVTMTTIITDETPCIWVCGLSCYNDGRLVGEWFDCTDPGLIVADGIPLATDRLTRLVAEDLCSP